MSLFSPTGQIRPSYKNGFAHYASESLYPSLWRNLIGAYSPSLGNRGLVTLDDLSGYKNHGVMNGSPVASDWSIDAGAYAFRFDGSNDYIDVGQNDVQRPTDVVSVSIRWKRDGAQPQFGAIIINGDSGSTPFGAYEIQFNNTADDDLVWHIGVGSDTLISFGVTINDGQWYHLIGTYDGATMREYVDGIETGVPTAISGTLDYGSEEGLRFGAQVSQSRFCPGKMGECLIWHRAITSNEVKQLYEIGSGGIFTKRKVVFRISESAAGSAFSENYTSIFGHLQNHSLDKDTLVGHTRNVSEDYTIPVEYVLGITGDQTVLVENTLGISDDKTIPIEISAEFDENKNVIIENTLSIPITDKIIPIENTLGISENKTLPVEHTTDLAEDKTIPIEHTSSTGDITETIPVEHVLGITGDKTIPIENTLAISEDKTIPIEHTATVTDETSAGIIVVLRNTKPSWKGGFAKCASESSTPNLWHGLIGAWSPSLGITGTNLLDISGRSNHGTLESTSPSIWTLNQGNMSLSFDGVDDLVRIPHNNSLNLDVGGVGGSYTIAVWENLAVPSSPDTNRMLISKTTGNLTANGPGGIGWGIMHDSSALHFFERDGSSANSTARLTTFGVDEGTGLHLLVATTMPGNIITYVDGLVATVRGERSESAGSDTTDDLSIAEWLGSSRHTEGPVFDFWIWNRTLTGDEIVQLYNAGPSGIYHQNRRLAFNTVVDAPTFDENKTIIIENILSISEDKTIPVENTLSLIEDKTIPVEHVLGVTDDETIPVEHILGISDNKTLPIEHTSDIAENKTLPIEHVLGITGDEAILVENILGVTDDETIPIENRLGISEDKQIPVENTLSITEDKTIPIEHVLSGEVIVETIPVENTLGISEDKAIPVEHTLSIAEDKTLPVEHTLSIDENKTIPIEHKLAVAGDFDEDKLVVIEHTLEISDDNTIPTEHTLEITEDKTIPVEHVLSTGVTVETIPTENLGRIDDSNTIPVEHTGQISIDKSTPIENTRSFTDQLKALVEHNLGVISDQDAIVEHTVQLDINKSVPIGHILEFISNLEAVVEHNREVIVNSDVLVEHVLEIDADITIPVEWSGETGVSFDKNVIIESISQLSFDNTVPLDSILSVTMDKGVVIDNLILVNENKDVELSFVSAISLDNKAPTGYITQVSIDETIPVESTAVLPVIQENIPVDNLIEIDSNKAIDVSFLAELSLNKTLVFNTLLDISITKDLLVEYLLQTGAVSKGVIVESLAGLDSDKLIPISWLGDDVVLDAIFSWIIKENKQNWVIKEVDKVWNIKETNKIWTIK